MRTLYIIGNGFDMWHGLPTSYGHFADFAHKLLLDIENYYSLDFNQINPWHDFENALGDFEPEQLLAEHNEIDVTADDFRPSFVYGLEDEMTEQANSHVDAIREKFVEWIQQIDVNEAAEKTEFPEDAVFISFNYTTTLQSVYGIDSNRILHIHGSVDGHDELIFGHGREIHNVPDVDENGDSTRDMFSDALDNATYPLHALKKPVDAVLVRHRQFFENLQGIETVVVIGHSLNEIDHPYFKRINDVLPDVSWHVIYYSEDDSAGFIQSLVACGVNSERIRCSGYDYFGVVSDSEDED